MTKTGLIGWRGMVGSVLMKRMHEERDFRRITPFYFSASASGATHRDLEGNAHTLLDAASVERLGEMDIIVTCQGGDYTKSIYPALRASGWRGYWIDAASAKRMDDDSLIVLDPVNREQIDAGLDQGIRNLIGGNCSITLSLIGLTGLFKAGLVDWMSIMTYQAASGAGAKYVRELLTQMASLSSHVATELRDPSTPVATLLEKARAAQHQPSFAQKEFGAPLAGSIIPWIDSDLGNGVSREEWKGEVETNKILGLPPGSIRVDGLCVRIAALQSHSASITLKLKEDIGQDAMEKLIREAHDWVDLVPNNKADSIGRLSPAAVSGSLRVAVGRLRPMSVGEGVYSVLTTGDQLLWGAAEPLRRALNIVVDRH
ncbi:aspartate-semialdehyde dehydrogenase [Caballeronia catudaia]|uniref:Aspartate-semialdehyde dehydrogenase n=1 Tax=Caballeronia catudaia TaxID=1777136 RepID=A0A157ZZW6_9BURK|nr:aspartate-semialdehyde dehydrogenase [Caballeronia catudaia]SAK51084.1 aspartate-semialdehyde dehydrogenase [Caballeronia catudaia]